MRKTPTMQHPKFKQCRAMARNFGRAKNKQPLAHKLIETLKQVLSEAPPRVFNNNQQ